MTREEFIEQAIICNDKPCECARCCENDICLAYKHYKKIYDTLIAPAIEQAKKDTAREVLYKVFLRLDDYEISHYDPNSDGFTTAKQLFKDLIKKYGLEENGEL